MSVKSNKYFCCGQQDVEFFDICDICGWQNDGLQNDKPDYACGANKESLNEYKAKWQSMHRKSHEISKC